MSNLIVITGVTGTQGSSVATTFLEEPDWRVRGITRDPSSAAARALAARGVEVVSGDLDNAASLAGAFDGATAVYCNTDYFSHIFAALKKGRPPGQVDDAAWSEAANHHAHEREVAQMLNVAAAAADPQVLRTLRRFVLSTLSDASARWPAGPRVWHFDSKAEAERQIRQRFPDLAARASHLHLGFYAENWRALAKLAPQRYETADGSSKYVLAVPRPPNARIPFVAAGRDTGAFVRALVELPAGRQLQGVGQYMTYSEYGALWGRVHGVSVEVRHVGADDFFTGVPAPLKDELWSSWLYMDAFNGAAGGPEVLTPDQLEIPVPVTSMEEWIRGEDWSSVLNSSRGQQL